MFLFFLAFFTAWAEAGEGGIPLGFVLSQIFNFSLFVLALFFLFRKKIPGFLKQKNRDFLEYEKKARALEKERKSACLLWREKMQTLKDKEKNLPDLVEKALSDLKEDLKAQEARALKSLKIKWEQETKRLGIKELNRLKTRFLSQVMEEVKKKMTLTEKDLEKLNYQSIQKWGRM